jgi:DNA-directed RNA polymerase subunit RPC12/RpoP
MNMEYKLCFRCATIYEPSEDGLIRCPKCQYIFPQERYDKLIDYARGAAEFGYNYRRAFERDYEEDGTCSRRYSLSFDEILMFCAAAALSGIIGNVAYDVIKAALNKIIVQHKSRGQRRGIATTEDILNDSHEFEIFVYYITDYYNGMPNLNPEIKNAILDEIRTHAAVDVMEQKDKMNGDSTDIWDDSDEALEKEIELVERTLAEESENIDKRMGSYLNPPERSDFDEFWQGFE